MFYLNLNGIFYYQYTTHLAILLIRIPYYFFISIIWGPIKVGIRMHPYNTIH